MISLVKALKHLFFNTPYITLYPLSEKAEAEQIEIIDAFNECDIAKETEISELLYELYDYTLSKVEMSIQDKKAIERNLNQSYKTKKKKVKDKETGEKEVSKVKTEKKGTKSIIEKYMRLQKENNNNTERYEDLLQAFECRTLSTKHIPLIDELIKHNKYKKWIYKALLIIVIAAPILIFVLAKVFKI